MDEKIENEVAAAVTEDKMAAKDASAIKNDVNGDVPAADSSSEGGKKEKKTKEKKTKEKKTKDNKKKGPVKKFFAFLWKHKILTIIVILIIGIGINYKNKANQAKAELENVAPETAMIEERDVVKTVSGTGKFIANESKELIIDDMAGQRIKTMNVRVGDMVKAGDVLCVFDTESIEKDLEDENARLKATSVTSGNSVDKSERSLTDTELDGVNNTYRNIEAVDKAQRILDTKKGELKEAQRLYDKEYEIFYKIYSEDKYYNLLEKEANGDLEGSDISDLSAIRSAKSTLDTLKTNITTAEKAVASAEEDLTRAQREYADDVRHDITSINNSTDNVEDAYASNSTAKLSSEKTIRSYETQLAAATVIAPFDGVITNVSVEEGNKYSSGALFKIEDASTYKVEVNIEEYYISDVAIGQEVTIKTNATGSDELQGVVSYVAPRATATNTTSTTSSTPTYKVEIDVTTPNDRIRMDMTAKIVITTAKRENVIAVPSTSIFTDDNGDRYIRVSKNTNDAADILDTDVASMSFIDRIKYNKGTDKEVAAPVQIDRVYVNVGLESDYYTEVTGDGIEAGMTVYLEDDSNTEESDSTDLLGGI